MITKHYLFCVISYLVFLNGWFVSSFGPLIPYFTEATGLDQTHYSYLFLVRSAANIAGGILIKYFIKKWNIIPLFNGLLVVIIVCLLFASFSLSTFNLAINLFCTSVALVSSVIIIYTVIFKLFHNQNTDFWIQIIGFVFGIGAMSGPILITIFKLQTFKALSFAHLIAILLLAKTPFPNLQQSGGYQQKSNSMKLSKKSVLLISITFFFFATQELGVASWISTYSIKAGVADTLSSSIYSTIFWVPNCFFRIFWMYMPGNVEYRLGLGLKGTILSIGMALILQYGQHYNTVCILLPICAGIFISGVFGFIIALPVDKGFTSSSIDNSNILLGNSFGEGLLIMPLGYSMGLFTFKVLIGELLLFSCLCYWVFTLSIKSMNEDKQKFQSSFLANQSIK